MGYHHEINQSKSPTPNLLLNCDVWECLFRCEMVVGIMTSVDDLHYRISIVKSIARIGGYLCLLYSIPFGVAVLVGSEFLGIAEEVWGA